MNFLVFEEYLIQYMQDMQESHKCNMLEIHNFFDGGPCKQRMHPQMKNFEEYLK